MTLNQLFTLLSVFLAVMEERAFGVCLFLFRVLFLWLSPAEGEHVQCFEF